MNHGTTARSSFATDCIACNDQIQPGELITWDDDIGEWVHADCFGEGNR